MAAILYFEPLDTLFCRAPISFAAGEDKTAESILPSPLTLYGVIGSYLIEQFGIDFKEFSENRICHNKIGAFDKELKNSKLLIKGPFFYFERNFYFSPPANLFFRGRSIPKIVIPSEFTGSKKWDIHDRELSKLSPLVITDTSNPSYDLPEPFEEYIDLNCLNKYLANELDIIENSRTEDELFFKEERYGHKIGISGTVEEHYLYSTTHLRFSDRLIGYEYERAKLAVSVENVDKDDFKAMTVKFGGEARQVKISATNMDELFKKSKDIVATKIKENKRFFLYFATPTIFENGWIRKWPFKGVDLVGSAVNKPIMIGGWLRNGSYSKGSPRQFLRAVPPGSVYFFKINGTWNEQETSDFYEKYNFNESLSEFYPAAGFGTALIGVW